MKGAYCWGYSYLVLAWWGCGAGVESGRCEFFLCWAWVGSRAGFLVRVVGLPASCGRWFRRLRG